LKLSDIRKGEGVIS